jgi:hypothetical protein
MPKWYGLQGLIIIIMMMMMTADTWYAVPMSGWMSRAVHDIGIGSCY